jgi:hypothetical protein
VTTWFGCEGVETEEVMQMRAVLRRSKVGFAAALLTTAFAFGGAAALAAETK